MQVAIETHRHNETADERYDAHSLIVDESAWLSSSEPSAWGRRSRVKLTSWMRREAGMPIETIARHDELCHIISFGLRSARVNFRDGQREIVSARFPANRPLLHAPTSSVRSAGFQGRKRKVGSNWLVGDRRLSYRVIADLERMCHMRMVREDFVSGRSVLRYIGEPDLQKTSPASQSGEGRRSA